MTPRGEFSIVIVKSGADLGAFVFPLVGVVSVVTAFMSPFLFKAGGRLAGPGPQRGRRGA